MQVLYGAWVLGRAVEQLRVPLVRRPGWTADLVVRHTRARDEQEGKRCLELLEHLSFLIG